jgi:hypothetical protein
MLTELLAILEFSDEDGQTDKHEEAVRNMQLELQKLQKKKRGLVL